MSESGWISVHRKIKTNWLYQKKPFDELHAWIDILLSVNHEPKKVVLGKTIVFVGRGSTITSIRKLSESWGWSRTKIVNFLNLLVSDGMLNFESDTKKTVLTVANYDFFQNCEKQKSHQKATGEPLKDTNNNDNNINNISLVADSSNDECNDRARTKKLFTSDSDAYKAAKYMADKIKKHTPNFPQVQDSKLDATIQRWAKDIDLMLRLDGIDFDEFKAVLQFSQTDPFWQRNILSGKKLREQYGTLLVRITERE